MKVNLHSYMQQRKNSLKQKNINTILSISFLLIDFYLEQKKIKRQGMLKKTVECIINNETSLEKLIELKDKSLPREHGWKFVLEALAKNKEIMVFRRVVNILSTLFLSGVVYIPLAYKYEIFESISVFLCVISGFAIFIFTNYMQILVTKKLNNRINLKKKQKRAMNLYIK